MGGQTPLLTNNKEDMNKKQKEAVEKYIAKHKERVLTNMVLFFKEDLHLLSVESMENYCFMCAVEAMMKEEFND